jgi:hypothetical protein
MSNEHFEQQLAKLDDAALRRIEMKARDAIRHWGYKEPEWLPDWPDPFEMNWSWLEQAAGTVAPPSLGNQSASTLGEMSEASALEFQDAYLAVTALSKEALYAQAIATIYPVVYGTIRLPRTFEENQSELDEWLRKDLSRMWNGFGSSDTDVYAHISDVMDKSGLLAATYLFTKRLQLVLRDPGLTIRQFIALAVAINAHYITEELYDSSTRKISAGHRGGA